MSKLIAVHYLVLASGVKGVLDEIVPGKAFEAREDEMHLVERGAARKPNANERELPLATRFSVKGIAGSTSGNTNSGGQAGTSANSGTQTDPAAAARAALAKLTKAQLLELAGKEEIEVDASLKNDEMIAVIEAGRAAKADGLI